MLKEIHMGQVSTFKEKLSEIQENIASSFKKNVKSYVITNHEISDSGRNYTFQVSPDSMTLVESNQNLSKQNWKFSFKNGELYLNGALKDDAELGEFGKRLNPIIRDIKTDKAFTFETYDASGSGEEDDSLSLKDAFKQDFRSNVAVTQLSAKELKTITGGQLPTVNMTPMMRLQSPTGRTQTDKSDDRGAVLKSSIKAGGDVGLGKDQMIPADLPKTFPVILQKSASVLTSASANPASIGDRTSLKRHNTSPVSLDRPAIQTPVLSETRTEAIREDLKLSNFSSTEADRLDQDTKRTTLGVTIKSTDFKAITDSMRSVDQASTVSELRDSLNQVIDTSKAYIAGHKKIGSQNKQNITDKKLGHALEKHVQALKFLKALDQLSGLSSTELLSFFQGDPSPFKNSNIHPVFKDLITTAISNEMISNPVSKTTQEDIGDKTKMTISSETTSNPVNKTTQNILKTPDKTKESQAKEAMNLLFSELKKLPDVTEIDEGNPIRQSTLSLAQKKVVKEKIEAGKLGDLSIKEIFGGVTMLLQSLGEPIPLDQCHTFFPASKKVVGNLTAYNTLRNPTAVNDTSAKDKAEGKAELAKLVSKLSPEQRARLKMTVDFVATLGELCYSKYGYMKDGKTTLNQEQWIKALGVSVTSYLGTTPTGVMAGVKGKYANSADKIRDTQDLLTALVLNRNEIFGAATA